MVEIIRGLASGSHLTSRHSTTRLSNSASIIVSSHMSSEANTDRHRNTQITEELKLTMSNSSIKAKQNFLDASTSPHRV